MKLRDYQLEAVHRLITKQRYVLGFEMGLGKTATVLSALRASKRAHFLVEPIVIVAPANVARGVWPQEGQKWFPEMEVRVVKHACDVRNGVINVVSFGAISGPNWGELRDVGTLVIDELTFVKNWNIHWSHASARAREVAAMADTANSVWGLTGSISPEGILDTWGMMAVVAPDALGRYKGTFRERYMMPITAGNRVLKWVPRFGAVEEVSRLCSPYVWALEAADVGVQLPEVVDQSVPVVLSDKRMREYKKMEREHAVEMANNDDITAFSASAVSMKLRQMAAGFIHDTENEEWHEIGQESLDAIGHTIDELNGESVLVMTQFKPEMKRIVDSFGAVQLSSANQDDWNSGKIRVAVAHPASTGHGLNLQHGGRHIIWSSPPWSREHWDQSIARLKRPGQASDTVFNHVVNVVGTVTENILSSLQSKKDIQDEFVRYMKEAV